MLGLVSYLVFFAIVVLIFAIATLGLNLQWGATGLFNAGVVGFYAVGGYALAILTGPNRPALIGGFELPFAVGLLGAMAASGIAALLIGLATVRLREDYLAVATFGTAVTIQLVALNFEPLTGGNLGISAIPRPLGRAFDSPLAYNVFYLGLVVVAAGAVYVALERVVRSPWGRVLKAIREDELAAVSHGKDARRFRLEAFVLGSVVIGLAGALYVGFVGYVSPFDFLPIVTFQVWTMLIVGGSGNNRGAIAGALLVWGLWTGSGALVAAHAPSEWQTRGGALQVILIGLVLVLILRLRPRGLIGEEPRVSRHLPA
ncbi:MAG: branched-chain amino acid ABC transporter permease [Candidatus Rokuibacteriota bacterium]